MSHQPANRPNCPHRHGQRTRRWRGEGGSAAVELTLATPLLIALLVFVAVIVHRGVDARLRLDDAAHQAARAASLARNPAIAVTAAEQTAADALAQAGVVCQPMAVDTDLTQFAPGGAVTVTVSCTVDHTDALPLEIPVDRVLTATFTSPVDTWRAVDLGSSEVQ